MGRGSKYVTVSGDKQLIKKLQSLSRKTASRIQRTASRKAAKLVLARAKSEVPRRSGAFAKSLTIRSIARSRTKVGHMVTQNKSYASKKNKTGATSSDPNSGFYGPYIELGYTATGRPHAKDRSYEHQVTSSHPMARRREGETLQEDVTTYRGTTFKIGQLRGATKVKARWVMRNAGRAAQNEAQQLYVTEMRQLISEAEASK